MTGQTPKSDNASKNYLISYQAIVCLGHLREHFHLTKHQAKDFYDIDDLSVPIKELLAAGHLIFETFLPISEQIGTTSIIAYTLGSPLHGLSNLAEILTNLDLKLFGGANNKALKQEQKITATILERSLFLMKIDLLNRLGMKSKLMRVLQKDHDTRLEPFVMNPTNFIQVKQKKSPVSMVSYE